MYYFYQDNEVKIFRGKPKPYHDQDANALWLVHYKNSKYLTFYVQNEPGFVERQQAAKELEVCQRKMDYWKRHVNFDVAKMRQQSAEVDKMWSK